MFTVLPPVCVLPSDPDTSHLQADTRKHVVRPLPLKTLTVGDQHNHTRTVKRNR